MGWAFRAHPTFLVHHSKSALLYSKKKLSPQKWFVSMKCTNQDTNTELHFQASNLQFPFTAFCEKSSKTPKKP